jgi:hypothetical protein
VKIQKRLAIIISSVLVPGLIWSLVCIQDVRAAPFKGGFQLTPYLWFPEVDADSAVGGQNAGLDSNFGDAFGSDHLAGGIRFEAWASSGVGFICEWMYFEFEPEGNLLTPGQNVHVNADIRERILEFALATRQDIEQSQSSNTNTPRPWLEAMSGFRFIDLKQELDLDPGGRLVASQDWFEPFIGMGIGFHPAKKWEFALRGDIGAFGWGTTPRLTWNVNAELGYEISRDVSVRFGYRVYDTDYSTYMINGRFVIDHQLMGPWLGMTFHF